MRTSEQRHLSSPSDRLTAQLGLFLKATSWDVPCCHDMLCSHPGCMGSTFAYALDWRSKKHAWFAFHHFACLQGDSVRPEQGSSMSFREQPYPCACATNGPAVLRMPQIYVLALSTWLGLQTGNIHACIVLATKARLQTHCLYALWPQAMSFPKLFSVIYLYTGINCPEDCKWLIYTHLAALL